MNVERINKLIGVLEADDGTHFLMDKWTQYLPHVEATPENGHQTKWQECGTACCFAGWANVLRLEETDPNWRKEQGYLSQLRGFDDAQNWLDLDYPTGQALFMMGYHGDDENPLDARSRFFNFKYLPPAVRREAGIAVLTHLRDTGTLVGEDWDRAIAAAQL